MKRDLVLHIGMSKTGSSSIQRVLAAERDALQAQGFYYVRSPGRANHALLPASLVLDRRSLWGFHPATWDGLTPAARLSRFRADWDAEMKALPDWANTCIISAEQIGGLLRRDEEVQRLADLLTPHFAGVKIIVYLRRQDRHVVSAYSQKLRGGITTTASLPGVESLSEDDYQYDRLLNRYARAFGNHALAPRIFDRAALVNGDVLDDFLHVAGVTLAVSAENRNREANVGLDLAGQKLLGDAARLLHGNQGWPATPWRPIAAIDGTAGPGRAWQPEACEARAVIQRETAARRERADQDTKIDDVAIQALMQTVSTSVRREAATSMTQFRLVRILGESQRMRVALLRALKFAPDLPNPRRELADLLDRLEGARESRQHVATASRVKRRWRWTGSIPVSTALAGNAWRNTPQWRYMAEAVSDALPGRGWRPSQDEARSFMAHFADSNERVRLRFFPGLPTLFSGDFTDLPEQADLPETADTLDAAIKVILHETRASAEREAAAALLAFRLHKRTGDRSAMQSALIRMQHFSPELAAPYLQAGTAKKPARKAKAAAPHGSSALPARSAIKTRGPAPAARWNSRGSSGKVPRRLLSTPGGQSKRGCSRTQP